MDHFATMLMILNSKIQQQQEEIEENYAVINSLRNQVDYQERNLETLRQAQVPSRIRESDFDFYKSEYTRLQAKIMELQHTPEVLAKAEACWNEQGSAQWKAGNKIAAIKLCRETTQWGLKEAREWCEAKGVAPSAK